MGCKPPNDREDRATAEIMVHGNNSSGKFFEESYNTEGEQVGFDFIQAFRREKLPFDNSILVPTEPIESNAAYLKTKIPAIAFEFGARHVHIVAHSKGGLDVRAFLADPPSNFGVLSLTTLSTRHHGSVGADYMLDARPASAIWSDAQLRTEFLQRLLIDPGTPDLRVSRLATFNDATCHSCRGL